MGINKNKLLINFFTKDLSEEDKKHFLDLASSDPDFVRSFIRNAEIDSLIEDRFKAKRKKVIKKREINKPLIIRISAIISGIAAIIIFFFALSPEPETMLSAQRKIYIPNILRR